MKGWVPTSVLAAVAGVVAVVVLSIPNVRRVAHRVEIAGAPGNYFEFVEHRSVLFRGRGYYLYFPDGGYDKHRLTASEEQLREASAEYRETSAEYDGPTLAVTIPGRHHIVYAWYGKPLKAIP